MSFNNCTFNGGGNGINGDNNTILHNNIINNDGSGLQIFGSFNKINESFFQNNDLSVSIYGSNNSIFGNNLSDNLFYGVSIGADSENNTIYNNSISNNDVNGIYLDFLTKDNLFYNNYFLNNTLHVKDRGGSDLWDNGSLGNYWDNYTGTDENDNGIGDIPYNISLVPLIQDRYPIWDDDEDVPPVISIISPNNNDAFGLTPPNFTVSIIEANLNTSWYQLNNGSLWSLNYTFEGLTETINQTAWDLNSNDTITIWFYANDSKGYMGSDSEDIIKDGFAPTINIVSPTSNQLFGLTSPNFTIEISDTRLDDMWYKLPNGLNHTFLYNSTFNVTEWEALSNGTATIWFYANDTVGNIASESVTVRIDAYTPDIELILPINNSFQNTPLSIQFLTHEAFNDTIWYNVTGNSTLIDISNLNNTLFYLDNYIWNDLSDGSFQISFFINDTAGNLNSTILTFTKDTSAPTITIDLPPNNFNVTRDAPTFNLTISDLSLNTTWYSLDGGITNFIFTGDSGTINQTVWQTIWDGLSHEDVITITFYANDSLGQTHSEQVQVKKYDPSACEDCNGGGTTPPIGDGDILLIFIIIGAVAGVAILGAVIILKKRGSSKEIGRIEKIIDDL